jgi:hypothetical protein
MGRDRVPLRLDRDQLRDAQLLDSQLLDAQLLNGQRRAGRPACSRPESRASGEGWEGSFSGRARSA